MADASASCFGLGEQIGGDPARVAISRDDHDLGRSATKSMPVSPAMSFLAAAT